MRCTRCGSESAPLQKFCGECGLRLWSADDGAPDAAIARMAEGERKQVTILFCDIVGSTPLAAQLGPDRMHRVLNEFLPMVEAHARDFDGHPNKFLGDGFMAVFGAPIAREDHARRAALAALAMRDAVATHAWVTLPAGERLEVRIGLNSGPVVFGSVGDGSGAGATAIGDTANVAARLQSQARPGQVVCSDQVAAAVEAFVHCRALGTRTLKGKPVPVVVFEIAGRRLAAATSATRMAEMSSGLPGRESECALIGASIASLAAGRGGILLVEGGAGLGKSRLLGEASRMAGAAGIRKLQGTCVSYGRALSYWPFREALRDALDIREDDEEATALRKLDAAFAQRFGDAGGNMTPFMALLLGLNPAGPEAVLVQSLDGMAAGHQIFLTSLRVIERLAEEKPLLFVLDDWQWADASSRALLAHLLPLAHEVPVLFAIAARPGVEGSGALAGSVLSDMRSDVLCRHIALEPLGDPFARQLLGALLGSGQVHAQLEARLLRQAAGNPFYLEEMVRALKATRAIVRDPVTGDWRDQATNGAFALPDSIEGVILARIDCLDGSAKQLLKVAAVIGRRINIAVLTAVAKGHGDLDADIEKLKAAELLQDGLQHPEPELMFRQPLIHQAVYDSLLEQPRRVLHHEVGVALGILHAARLEDAYPVLAHHFARAHDQTRAHEYLLLAGNQAGRIAADAEALEYYDSALRAAREMSLSLDPVRRAELAASMAEALYRLGRYDAALDHALTALAGLGFAYPRAPHETRRAIMVKLAARALRRGLRPLRGIGAGGRLPADGAYRAASRLFEVVGAIDYFLDPPRFVLGILTMLEEAERRPPSRAMAISTSSFGLICDTLGLYRLAAALHRRAMSVAVALDDRIAVGYCNHMTGLHQYSTGQWTAALATLAAGAAQLDASGHLRFWASCTGANYFVLRSMGDPRWMDLARRQLEVAESIGDDHAIAWAVNSAGVAHLYRGDHASARVLFEKASVAYEAIPDYRFLSGALARRALCHALADEMEAALALLERSRSLVVRYRITGMLASAPLLVAAEAYLCIVQGTADRVQRACALKLARAACTRATRHGRRVGDESAAEALRLNGILAWVCGDAVGATKVWGAALDSAHAMGARYVQARTHHDLAVLAEIPGHTLRARELFEATGSGPYQAARRDENRPAA